MNLGKILCVSLGLVFLAACGSAPGAGGGPAGSPIFCLYKNEDGDPAKCSAFIGANFRTPGSMGVQICGGEEVAACPTGDLRLGTCKFEVGGADEFHDTYYGEGDTDEEREDLRSSFQSICETGGAGVWSE